MEALEIIKEKNTATQVRMKFMDYKEHIETTVDITDVKILPIYGFLETKERKQNCVYT